MKRILVLLLFAALASPVVVSAQGVKSANSIKRNSSYLYAEATMETAAEAYEVASELLYVQAKEYASGKKAFADKDILLRNIRSQQDSIQMRRGEMYKVFLYIRKSDVIDVENVTLVSEDKEILTTAALTQPEEKRETVPSAGSREEPGQADASLKLSSLWQQALVDELLNESSFASAKAKLARYRAEFKVKNTGPISTCRNLPEAFLLVGKEGRVLTVLGPGETQRTDFRSLTETTLDKYSGTDIVWFNLAK